MRRGPDPYGLSRVLRPSGVMPQAAEQLDPSLPIGPDELLISVSSLNVDAASFRQLSEEAGGNPGRIAARIEGIVAQRGKLQNPVTGSGGMLIGTVREVGPGHPAAGKLAAGDRLATLVSLTLTPLLLEAVEAVHPGTDRVDVRGHAILFASGAWAKLPADFPEKLALAALDVCGAPALVARLARKGDTVLVLGAGKSGALCCAQARDAGARVLALDVSPQAVGTLRDLGLADEALVADARVPMAVLEAVQAVTSGAGCDLVVNCASVPGTELSSILPVKDRGTVVFFSMATSFTAATLGAEGVGKDANLVMGNGYAQGHAELTLDLLRRHKGLYEFFERRYG